MKTTKTYFITESISSPRISKELKEGTAAITETPKRINLKTKVQQRESKKLKSILWKVDKYYFKETFYHFSTNLS